MPAELSNHRGNIESVVDLKQEQAHSIGSSHTEDQRDARHRVPEGMGNGNPSGEPPKFNEQSTTKYAYSAKKTIAQGMMDLALVTANANQLRYVILYQRESPTYYFVFTLIVISIMIQVVVGICLIFKGRLDLKGKEKLTDANTINNYVIGGLFLVTIINVFIAAFSISPEAPRPVVNPVP